MRTCGLVIHAIQKSERKFAPEVKAATPLRFSPIMPLPSLRPIVLALAALSGLSACAVVTVAGAAVSVAASALSITASAVETTVDVAAAGVDAIVGEDDEEQKEQKDR